MLVVVLVLVLAIAAALVLLVSVGLRRGEDARSIELERRFVALGEALSGKASRSRIEVEIEGRPFVLRMRLARRGKGGFEVATPLSSEAGRADRLPIEVRIETSIDRLGKRLRINREVQTGDAVFDEAVYVESDAPDADVRRVLGDADVRRRIVGMLERGFQAVTIDERRGRVVAVRDPEGAALDVEAVREVCRDLASMASSVPPPPEGSRPPPLWLAGPITAAVSAVAAFVGVTLVSWSRSGYYPLEHGASLVGGGIGLVAWLCALPLVGALVRGRSVSFRLFGACACLLFVALPLSGAGLAVGLNGRMDGGEPALHQARIHAKRSRSYKQSTSYEIDLDGLAGAGAPVEVVVDRELFLTVHEGDDVVVEVGRGRFGWRWLRGVRRR